MSKPHIVRVGAGVLCTLSLFILCSCSLFENIIGPSSSHLTTAQPTAQNPWTIMVYMNGDNDLSSDAFADLNAMEAADLTGSGITVIALVDLGSNGSSITGGWTGARLYQVEYDSAGVNSSIVSTRLGSSALGLTTTGTDEPVDMGSAATLTDFVSYCESNYPAQHDALVMWGHADGWRSIGSDATSNSELTLGDMGQALSGTSLDVVGFDTPAEATIETADELAGSADYLVASEGTSVLLGWDLQSILTSFAASSLTPTDLTDSIVSTYESTNQTVSGANISAIDLSKTSGVITALDKISTDLQGSIQSSSGQQAVQNMLLTNVQHYGPQTPPGDEYIDLWSLADVLETPPTTTPATPNYANQTDEEALKSAVDAAVVQEWHNSSGSNNSHGLAVYSVSLGSTGTPASPPVDSQYVGTATAPNALSFFSDSTWPPADGSGTSGALWAIWLKTVF